MLACGASLIKDGHGDDHRRLNVTTRDDPSPMRFTSEIRESCAISCKDDRGMTLDSSS